MTPFYMEERNKEDDRIIGLILRQTTGRVSSAELPMNIMKNEENW